MRSFKDYLDRLRLMRPNIYMGGQLIKRDDPTLLKPMNNIKLTFDLAFHTSYQDLLVTISPFTRNRVNRFCHLNNSSDDLLKKQEMTRVLCQKTPTCVERCMGVDMLNAFSVVCKEIDDTKKTDYYYRFIDYLKYFQENDLVGCAAQTDVKGDRSLRPHLQSNLDAYLRVVEKRKDGIVVRGAKAHNSIAAYADEILVSPTRALTKEESDWAVAFAIPADTEGVYQTVVAPGIRSRIELKAPVAEFGSCHSLTIFENTFVPWERVFMCGEWEFGARMAYLFALFHRHSYTGCKPAGTDIVAGLCALAAEYSGIERAPHIRSKLAELISIAELVYASGIAASVKAKPSSSGTYIPEFTYSNVGRRHAGINYYHEFDILCDIAGGLPATLPFEQDFLNPKIGPLLNKYMERKSGINIDDQHRLFRMISDILCSGWGACHLVGGVHGGGSPIMEDISLLSFYDLEHKKEIVKQLAGIQKEGYDFSPIPVGTKGMVE